MTKGKHPNKIQTKKDLIQRQEEQDIEPKCVGLYLLYMNGDLLWVQKAGKCLDVYYVSHIGVCNFDGNLIPKVREFLLRCPRVPPLPFIQSQSIDPGKPNNCDFRGELKGKELSLTANRVSMKKDNNCLYHI